MAGPWREWKTQSRVPTLPTGPWKSLQHREIPTFPRPGFAPDGKGGNQKPVSPFPTRGSRRRSLFLSNQQKHTQEHGREPSSTTSLLPGWKRGKPETGFPLSHAGLATTITFSIQPTKTQKGAWPGTPVHTLRFHAHSALEPNRTFMLILRLENATDGTARVL